MLVPCIPVRDSDMVAGPVASSWRQRLLHADVDQISFHTSTAADLLDNSNPFVSWMQNP